MQEITPPSFAEELHIPPWPVLILLSLLATILPLFTWPAANMAQSLRAAIILYGLVLISWGLNHWWPVPGRWVTVLASVLAVLLLQDLFALPGMLALLALPTALAAALVGTRESLVFAFMESVLLASLGGWLFPDMDGLGLVIALAAIWGATGLMYAAYRPVRQLAQWSWEYFVHARDLLEEARDRQVELKEALDALAHANRELALANEKLAAMRLIAEEAQKTKAAFVANVSHEFRTPLNIIIGLAEILLDAPQVFGEELPPNVRQNLQILYRNCEHLTSMINDVLDLSQVEAGRLALHKDWVDLRDLIASALVVVRPLLENKGLHLEVALPDDLPLVYCDPTRIRQVILNLTSNAARFTEQGGLSIQVEQEGSYVVTRVTDTGPGIAPQDVERIFEPFQQATTQPQRRKNGSGLGLSISKQFVELHGGKMWVQSTLGVGSTFAFRLPLSLPEGPIAPPHRWILEGWIQRRIRPPVPETHLDQSFVLCDEAGGLCPILAGYADEITFVDTRTLEEATIALQRVAAQALIVNTPSPEQLLPRLAEATAQIPDIPIIGCSFPPRAERALAAGARGYLLKPIKRQDIAQLLDSLDMPVRHVLVVDDDEDTLWLLKHMLISCDATLRVSTASNGSEGLEAMRNDMPDLVLLDVILPDMTGWEVLATKAAEERISALPVYLVSAQDPHDRPLTSPFVVARMGEGLSIAKLLTCSRELSALLLRPDAEPH